MIKEFSTQFLLILLGIAILYIIFLQQCGSPPLQNNHKCPAQDTLVKEVIKVDSFKVEVPIRVESTITKVDSFIDTVYASDRSLFEYVSIIDDSLIEGKITSLVDGTLVKPPTLEYKPKFPVRITKTVEKTISHYKEYKVRLYGGVDIGFNEISPEIELVTLRGFTYSVGYNVFQPEKGLQNLRIGLKKEIFSK